MSYKVKANNTINKYNGIKYIFDMSFFCQAAKEKGNDDLALWASSVRNHFWYCSRNCEGNVNQFKISNIIDCNTVGVTLCIILYNSVNCLL